MIPESALIEQLQLYRGWAYGGEHYPAEVPGISVTVRQGEGWRTNCCCFVEGLVLPPAGEHVVGLNWGWARHKDMMIIGEDMFGPITALCAAGLATPVDFSPPPAWTIVQGWRRMGPEPSGHTFVVARATPERLLILEANRGLGVGWRGVGPLSAELDTPDRAWAAPASQAWTWVRLRQTYPHLRMARLLVDVGG